MSACCWDRSGFSDHAIVFENLFIVIQITRKKPFMLRTLLCPPVRLTALALLLLAGCAPQSLGGGDGGGIGPVDGGEGSGDGGTIGGMPDPMPGPGDGVVRLTVRKSGPGASRILSDPPGLDCGGTCAASFPTGTRVHLRLQSDPGTYLVGWTAGPCAGAAACDVTLQDDTSVEAQFYPRVCPSPRLCFDSPYAQAYGLSDVLRFSAQSALAVGTDVQLRWNGVGWLADATGSDAGPVRMWGFGPSDLYAGSGTGDVIHYDGTKWATVLGGDSFVKYLAVFGTAQNNIWTVGNRGRSARFDGTRWIQSPVIMTQALQAVHGTSASDIWAVGESGYIVHFTGSAWSQVPSGTTQGLLSVFAVAPNDAWAVGETGTVRRWNGSAWQAVSIGTTDSLTRVRALSARDVWVTSNQGRVFHYDGAAWSSQRLGPVSLSSISGEANDLLVVGARGSLARYDGTGWRTPFQPLPGDLRAVHGFGPEDIWALGGAGLLAHFDGYGWQVVPSGTSAELRGLWASSPRDLWIVGDGGTVLRYDGAAFRSVSGAAATNDLKAVAGTGPADVWIVGSEGILRWDGAALSPFDPMLKLSFSQVLPIAPGEVYVAEGLLAHYKSGQRTLTSTPDVVVGLWGSAGDVSVGFQDGTVRRFDDRALGAAQSAGVGGSARFSRGGGVFAFGDGGVARLDGASFTRLATGALSLSDAWGTGPNETWLVGAAGTVLRYRP